MPKKSGTDSKGKKPVHVNISVDNLFGYTEKSLGSIEPSDNHVKFDYSVPNEKSMFTVKVFTEDGFVESNTETGPITSIEEFMDFLNNAGPNVVPFRKKAKAYEPPKLIHENETVIPSKRRGKLKIVVNNEKGDEQV